jgi:hypothetical protein
MARLLALLFPAGRRQDRLPDTAVEMTTAQALDYLLGKEGD